MILGVKIKNNENGLFRLKDGSFSKNGKTYSTLGFAKSSITNDVGYYNINKALLNCDFVIFNDDCTIETIPVRMHIIDVLERRLKGYEKTKLYYEENNYPTKNVDDSIFRINHQLEYLKKEKI